MEAGPWCPCYLHRGIPSLAPTMAKTWFYLQRDEGNTLRALWLPSFAQWFILISIKWLHVVCRFYQGKLVIFTQRLTSSTHCLEVKSIWIKPLKEGNCLKLFFETLWVKHSFSSVLLLLLYYMIVICVLILLPSDIGLIVEPDLDLPWQPFCLS